MRNSRKSLSKERPVRTEHNRTNAHRNIKLKIGQITVLATQPQGLANTCSKTAHSMTFSGERDKLFGDPEALLRTTAFV